MTFHQPPHRKLTHTEELQKTLMVLELIQDVEPKVMVLAQALESDVLHAAFCVLQRERMSIQVRMTGQGL